MGIAETAMKTFICSYQIINYIDLISCSKTEEVDKNNSLVVANFFFFKTYFGKYFFDSEPHFHLKKNPISLIESRETFFLAHNSSEWRPWFVKRNFIVYHGDQWVSTLRPKKGDFLSENACDTKG